MGMKLEDKPLVWLHGEIKTPPLSEEARLEVGALLRRLQRGEGLGLPHSRPLPSLAPRCHELRVIDRGVNRRIIYRVDQDAIVILEVFEKKTAQLPRTVLDTCKRRLRLYDSVSR